MTHVNPTPSQAELDEVLALVRADRHASALGRIIRWPEAWADRVRLMILYREGHHERAAEVAVSLAARGWVDASVVAVIALVAREPKHRDAARAVIEQLRPTTSVPVDDLVRGDLAAWARYVRVMLQTGRSVEAVAAVTLADGTGSFGAELWALLAGECLALGDVRLARHALAEGLTRFPDHADLGDASALLELEPPPARA